MDVLLGLPLAVGLEIAFLVFCCSSVLAFCKLSIFLKSIVHFTFDCCTL